MSFCNNKNCEELFGKKIDEIEAEGGTSIEDGLKVALKALRNRKFFNRVTSVILLSDGEDNKLTSGGLDNLFLVYNSCTNNKKEFVFNINCFGYGADCNEDQLKMISDKKVGKFYFLDTMKKLTVENELLNDIKDCFESCLADVQSVLANECVIDLKLLPSNIFPEIAIKKVFGNSFKGDSETKRKIIAGH